SQPLQPPPRSAHHRQQWQRFAQTPGTPQACRSAQPATRSEQPSGAYEWRTGPAVQAWHTQIPNTGRPSLAAAQSFCHLLLPP
ncbi:hypothetical protein BRM87_00460, partial [Xanthomonas oryzae pv. oryzae]